MSQCEVCDEEVGEGELIGCEECGRMFCSMCGSIEDSVCCDCFEGTV